MADRMTKEQRHLCMSHIRSRDTGPELAVRKALFADGFRFRVNVSSLPGSPDIVLRKYNTVIFVHGCFWHGHSGCRLYTVPGSNTRFWEDKVARNRRRDAAVAVRLEARGWNIITIWECSLDAKHREKTLAGVEEQLRTNMKTKLHMATERKARSELARRERIARRTRYSGIEKEISGRYRIPASVRKASLADGDDEYSDF